MTIPPFGKSDSLPFFEGFQYSEQAKETLLRRISILGTGKGDPSSKDFNTRNRQRRPFFEGFQYSEQAKETLLEGSTT
jgi:hypothetical protein